MICPDKEIFFTIASFVTQTGGGQDSKSRGDDHNYDFENSQTEITIQKWMGISENSILILDMEKYLSQKYLFEF